MTHGRASALSIATTSPPGFRVYALHPTDVGIITTSPEAAPPPAETVSRLPTRVHRAMGGTSTDQLHLDVPNQLVEDTVGLLRLFHTEAAEVAFTLRHSTSVAPIGVHIVSVADVERAHAAITPTSTTPSS